MEKLGQYQEAVDYTCKYRQSLALELTNRYKQDGKLSKDYTDKIADREIKKFTKLGEFQKAKPWLRFISDIENFIGDKKSENIIVAFRVLKMCEEFDRAFFYARAQAMFTEGIKLATEIGKPDMVTTFQLQQATQEISSSRKIEAKGLLDNIKTIAVTHNNLYIVARALVLLARHEGENISRDVRIANCEQARDIYKNKFANRFGEIECYNVLRGLKSEENLHIRIKETIIAIKTVNELIQGLNSKKLVIFFGFEPTEKEEIYIPKNQDQWRIGYNKPANRIDDMDGMVRVSLDNLCQLVQSHLAKHTNTWLDDVMSRLDNSFRACGFACHNDVKKKQPIQKSYSVVYNVERYAFLFELENQIVKFAEEHKMSRIFSKRWIRKPIETLVHLLSPYSQVHLQNTEKEYTAIRESSLKPFLIERLKQLDFSCDSFDALLNAWQIHTALNLFDEVHLSYEVTHRVHDKCLSVWLRSNQLLRKGENILQAIEESVQCFVENKKRCNCLENVTATFTVYTTALLTMFSYSRRVELFIPETFSKFVNYFNTINSKQPGVDFYEACLATAKKLKAKEVNEKVVTLLRQILMLLLEELCLGQLEAPEDYYHTLMLILTIFGNLILHTDKSKLRGKFEKILQLYENIPIRFSEAYANLTKVKTARDLFQAIDKALEKMEMNVRKLTIQHQEEADSIVFSLCKLDKISITDIP